MEVTEEESISKTAGEFVLLEVGEARVNISVEISSQARAAACDGRLGLFSSAGPPPARRMAVVAPGAVVAAAAEAQDGPAAAAAAVEAPLSSASGARSDPQTSAAARVLVRF